MAFHMYIIQENFLIRLVQCGDMALNVNYLCVGNAKLSRHIISLIGFHYPYFSQPCSSSPTSSSSYQFCKSAKPISNAKRYLSVKESQEVFVQCCGDCRDCRYSTKIVTYMLRVQCYVCK